MVLTSEMTAWSLKKFYDFAAIKGNVLVMLLVIFMWLQ